MAVTKTLIEAAPTLSAGVVVNWNIGMLYVDDDTGYEMEYSTSVQYDDNVYSFGLSAESDWNTQQQLIDLCPLDTWDNNFSIMTSPSAGMPDPYAEETIDSSYVIPTEE